MGQVALHPPAALGGAEPWVVVGVAGAGPGQGTQLGVGKVLEAEQQLGC